MNIHFLDSEFKTYDVLDVAEMLNISISTVRLRVREMKINPAHINKTTLKQYFSQEQINILKENNPEDYDSEIIIIPSKCNSSDFNTYNWDLKESYNLAWIKYKLLKINFK